MVYHRCNVDKMNEDIFFEKIVEAINLFIVQFSIFSIWVRRFADCFFIVQGCMPTRCNNHLGTRVCTCSRLCVRMCRLQIYILLYYTKHDERKGSRNAGGGRLVSFKFPFWSFPIKRPIKYYKSNFSRSRILCVSLDLTRCLAIRVKWCSVKGSI